VQLDDGVAVADVGAGPAAARPGRFGALAGERPDEDEGEEQEPRGRDG
jgi:hypothetical protein